MTKKDEIQWSCCTNHFFLWQRRVNNNDLEYILSVIMDDSKFQLVSTCRKIK